MSTATARLVEAVQGDVSYDRRCVGATEPLAPSHPPRQSTQGRILVVEDEPTVLKMTMEVLNSMPEAYHVTGAADVHAALNAIHRNQPHLVVLDLHLGRSFDGLDICRDVRAQGERWNTAVIVLTGELMESAESMLLDAGADDYIRKAHFTPELLESRVRAVLRRTPRRRRGSRAGPRS